MTKLCPLCQLSLKHVIVESADMSINFDYYECPVKATSKSRVIEYSHYKERPNGSATVIIHPYKIETAIPQVQGEEQKYGIFRWGRKELAAKNAIGGTMFNYDWVWLMTIPVIPIEAENKLRERIETLVTFS